MADALALGASALLMGVGVQVPPPTRVLKWAPFMQRNS